MWDCTELQELFLFHLRSFWSDIWTATWNIDQAGTRLQVVFLPFMVFWWSWTYRAPNSLELEQLFMPFGATWLRSRRGATHDTCCSWNWVLFRLIVLVVSRPSQNSPHSVPNSSPVLLRNVSWGLGVCSVFVRSVSPRRLVLEVRSFPSPPALFWPFARRLCPLFPSSCLSGLTRLRPGVCVRNT